MKYSQFFLKTNKEAREYDSVNATLLQKGGFIHQTMAGVYTWLPLGLRVLNKIENIVREEMNKLGSELLMPALSPRDLWQATGRLTSVDVLFEARGGNEGSRKKNDATYVLNSTHEEVITPIVQHFRPSYKDLPCAVYQIQTKYRNEPRAKSGLLRGREFRMKDLYSFHASEEDFKKFYERAKEAYRVTFERLGLGADTHEVLASGGNFTKEYSHEFDTLCATGEDTLYFDEKENVYYNKEVAAKELLEGAQAIKACEVGNIFPLGTRFPEAFGYTVTDESGKKIPVYMGSYGIGTSRVMGVLVEKFHDDRGIVWPEQVAPFQVHLAGLNTDASSTYEELTRAGIEVLYDDRENASAGEKLTEADLLGIPWRVVVSKKTGDKIEVKRRGEGEVKLMEIKEFLNYAQTP